MKKIKLLLSMLILVILSACSNPTGTDTGYTEKLTISGIIRAYKENQTPDIKVTLYKNNSNSELNTPVYSTKTIYLENGSSLLGDTVYSQDSVLLDSTQYNTQLDLTADYVEVSVTGTSINEFYDSNDSIFDDIIPMQTLYSIKPVSDTLINVNVNVPSHLIYMYIRDNNVTVTQTSFSDARDSVYKHFKLDTLVSKYNIRLEDSSYQSNSEAHGYMRALSYIYFFFPDTVTTYYNLKKSFEDIYNLVDPNSVSNYALQKNNLCNFENEIANLPICIARYKINNLKNKCNNDTTESDSIVSKACNEYVDNLLGDDIKFDTLYSDSPYLLGGYDFTNSWPIVTEFLSINKSEKGAEFDIYAVYEDKQYIRLSYIYNGISPCKSGTITLSEVNTGNLTIDDMKVKLETEMITNEDFQFDECKLNLDML